MRKFRHTTPHENAGNGRFFGMELSSIRTPRRAPVRSGDDAFDLYMLISPVVVLYDLNGNFHADEHNHAGRLMRLMDRLARKKIAVVGMVCERGALTRSSIRALNCYLHHTGSLTKFRNVVMFAANNRHGWAVFQTHVGLRWAR